MPGQLTNRRLAPSKTQSKNKAGNTENTGNSASVMRELRLYGMLVIYIYDEKGRQTGSTSAR